MRTGTPPENHRSGRKQHQHRGQQTNSYHRRSQPTAIYVHSFLRCNDFAQIVFAQISGEIRDGARGFAPANLTWQSCSRLAGSLELAEKLNNYLNIRRIDKSSEPAPAPAPRLVRCGGKCGKMPWSGQKWRERNCSFLLERGDGSLISATACMKPQQGSDGGRSSC